jgi:hypothetical protein
LLPCIGLVVVKLVGSGTELSLRITESMRCFNWAKIHILHKAHSTTAIASDEILNILEETTAPVIHSDRVMVV